MSLPLIDMPWWGYVIVMLVFTHITIVGTTLFLHRSQAHRALNLSPVVSHFFRFWLWLSTGQVTREWIAVHRKHHAKVETEDDPHSPQAHGIHRVLWLGALLYHREIGNQTTLEQYGMGAPDDWVERHVYTPHSWYGPALMLAINLVLFGLPGILIWAAQMLWIPFWAAGVINGIGHYFGYRNFETPDASRNIVPWGILIGGEELHNNHHAFAGSARFSVRPWELDIGWLYVRVLEKCKLARVRKTVPMLVVRPDRTHIDKETIAAVLANRVQIMADFRRHVLSTLCKDELRRTGRHMRFHRNLLKRARGLLSRDAGRMDESALGSLDALLKQFPRLNKAYAMKQHLLTLWQRNTPTPEKLKEAIEDWCRQAEASGIDALHEFSRRLRAYALVRN